MKLLGFTEESKANSIRLFIAAFSLLLTNAGTANSLNLSPVATSGVDICSPQLVALQAGTRSLFRSSLKSPLER